VNDVTAAAAQHLERLAAAYGADLPLPVPAAAARPPAAPPAPAATPTPAAERLRSPETPPPAAATAPRRPDRAASPPPPPAPPAPAAGERDAALQALRAEVMPCVRCKLHTTRRTVVFGEGNPHARVLFVGEAPGSVEDQTGRPFVGPAGQLLDRILAGAMGLKRMDV